MYKKVIFGSLVLAGMMGLAIGFYNLSCFAQGGETITITTYYPAPFGVYKELRAKRMAIGDNYYDASGYAWGVNIDSNADLVVEGNVGIGTITPQDLQDGRDIKLDVKNNIITDDVYLRNPKNGNARWASEGAGGIIIHRFENLPNDGDTNTGISADAYYCVATGWSADWDTQEDGSGINMVWTHSSGGTWWIRAQFHSHKGRHEHPDVDVLCFPKEMVTWQGASTSLNRPD